MELQPSHNTDEDLELVVSDLLGRTRKRLSRLERLRAAAGKTVRRGKLALSWEDVSLDLSFGSKQEEGLAEQIFEAVDLAVAKGREGLVLLLDEVQLIRDQNDRHGEHPLSLLVAPVVALQREQVPLAVVVCGLPTLAANLQKARSCSERLFRGEVVDSLPRDEALNAFARPLEETARRATEEVAGAVVEEVEGYPYFIQLWGSELWEAAEMAETDEISLELLNASRSSIYERLDRDFYEPRIATLTPAEQDLLLDSSQCPYPPLVSADLNQASSKTPGNVNVLLGRLVEAGAIYRIRKGEYAYTAPKSREFLQRRFADEGVA